MRVYEALKQRKSTRAFLSKNVEMAAIKRILEHAKCAPSGVNTQPWKVAVVSGETKKGIQKKMEAEFVAGNRGKSDYRYYPTQWIEPYKSRRVSCGLQLYSAVGISRGDAERRLEQWKQNYLAFGAPVVLFVYMTLKPESGSYMDCGMFIQSVMLAALQEGLATCPQAALAEYPEIVKTELGIEQSSVLLCGIAIGYEDTNAAINQYRTPREPLESFTSFYE